ncbi:D-lactate dehydrogenase [Catalinimonas alkaloidigena]|uniref:D-lactate dehydrogenase n=1 Tax=Catalinimonas alkaloidigena TaxID=1075417 RepID=A0A1G9BN04_9BACT|nr:2-hydroxyacid dehydrogenase [Catalinimonas alkaloidigena]SDK40793.1 D-lactate dehydrogenase [Catalinimonas alkaloidigena]
MHVTFYSTRRYDERFFNAANEHFGHQLHFYDIALNTHTANFARNQTVGDAPLAVCIFVNDHADAPVLERLAAQRVELLALRSAGFNHVDLDAAQRLGLRVVRVPAYSPHSIAEHTLALVLALNRKTHRAYNRVKENNFSLDGLMGFDLYGLTVGIVGLGKIGVATARIFQGFGCRVLGYDPVQTEADHVEMGSLDTLLRESDIISLHCPLTPETHHLINADTIGQMKHGVMLINTSRGALIHTQAVVDALKREHIGYLGLDVYEEEDGLFFEDQSDKVVQDDVFMRLLTFPNVLITGHQAFFTRNAVEAIAQITLQNISDFEQGQELKNQVTPQ